jgi:hypothetical protein
VITLTAAATIAPAGIVAAMTFCTCGSFKIDGMAVGAGGTMVVQTAALTAGIGVIKGGIPIAGGVALGTIGTELSEMGGRLGVTGYTRVWRIREDVIGMAPGTGQPNMPAGQGEGLGVAELIV